MRKMYITGGQKSTIVAPCGKTYIGHPTETDKKFQRHIRYCEKCPKNIKTPTAIKFKII